MTGSDTCLLLAGGGVLGGLEVVFMERAAAPTACGEKLCLGECASAKVREPRRELRILDVSGRGGRWAVTRKKERVEGVGGGSRRVPTGWWRVCGSWLKLLGNK